MEQELEALPESAKEGDLFEIRDGAGRIISKVLIIGGVGMGRTTVTEIAKKLVENSNGELVIATGTENRIKFINDVPERGITLSQPHILINNYGLDFDYTAPKKIGHKRPATNFIDGKQRKRGKR